MENENNFRTRNTQNRVPNPKDFTLLTPELFIDLFRAKLDELLLDQEQNPFLKIQESLKTCNEQYRRLLHMLELDFASCIVLLQRQLRFLQLYGLLPASLSDSMHQTVLNKIPRAPKLPSQDTCGMTSVLIKRSDNCQKYEDGNAPLAIEEQVPEYKSCYSHVVTFNGLPVMPFSNPKCVLEKIDASKFIGEENVMNKVHCKSSMSKIKKEPPPPLPITPRIQPTEKPKGRPPPIPHLSLWKQRSNIVLTWHIKYTISHSEIKCYEIFMYTDRRGQVDSSMWKKHKDIPYEKESMKYVLKDYTPTKIHYFAVRAVDIYSRPGLYSNIVS